MLVLYTTGAVRRSNSIHSSQPQNWMYSLSSFSVHVISMSPQIIFRSSHGVKKLSHVSGRGSLLPKPSHNPSRISLVEGLHVEDPFAVHLFTPLVEVVLLCRTCTCT